MEKFIFNEKTFFEQVKAQKLFSKLSQIQVDNFIVIKDEFIRVAKTNADLRYLAYIYATVYHETAGSIQPIREYGKGGTRPYARKIKMSGKPYTTPNQIYYGRGFVQLTWYENYELMGRLLGYDFLNNPDLLLESIPSAKVLIEGMLRGSSSFGDFTGRCLEMYITSTSTDYVGCRKIINGTDKADLIAGYAGKFYKSLTAA